MCLAALLASFVIWLSTCTCVNSAPTSDDFESIVTTSGEILSLIVIPIIMFTMMTCCIKKSDLKVVFAKSDEGTFKVTIVLPPHDTADDMIKDMLEQNQNKNTGTTISTLVSDNIIVPNSNELHVLQLSQSPTAPRRNQTLDNNRASLGSDVIISPNPSYNVAKSNEEKFTLSESLYIYCAQPSTEEDIEEKVPSVQQALKEEYTRECGNTLHMGDDVTPVRSTSFDCRTAHGQSFDDSIEQTANAAREECDNALYGVREYHNALYTYDKALVTPSLTRSTSYEYIQGDISEDSTQQTVLSNGRKECDNALYQVSTLHAGDNITMSHNPSYRALSDGYGYEYVPDQTPEDTIQHTGGRKECDNSLYEARKYENVDSSNPDPKTVVTRPTSQSSYDYVYEDDGTHEYDETYEYAYGVTHEYEYADYNTHDYSLIDSVKVSDNPNHDDHHNMTTKDTTCTDNANPNVVNGSIQNPLYEHEVTVLKTETTDKSVAGGSH